MGVRGPLSSSSRFLPSRPVVRAGKGVTLKGATGEWQLAGHTVFLPLCLVHLLSLLQSNKVPVVQHPHHMHPLTPLITYSNDHFSPASPPTHLSPEIDPKTGIPRPPHPSELSPYYPLSPGAVGQIPHPLGWLVPQQGQPMYSLPPGGFRHPYPALAMNASMSSLVSSRFPHMVAPAHPGLPTSGIPHPAIVSPIVKQEPAAPSLSPAVSAKSPVTVKKEEEKKPHVKKPLNAFMLYMKEMRAKVVAECTLKESAAINQILGRKVMPAAVNSSWQRGLRVSAYPDGSVCLHPLSLSGTTQERSGEGLPSLF